MRYERVKVTRDTNTVHNIAVALWEIPVLEFLFEDVERLDQFETVDREYPEPAKELDRLVRAYGSDPKSGIPHANSVFGNARAGIRSLTKMIEDAKAEDAAATQEAAPAPKRRGRKAAAAESLLS